MMYKPSLMTRAMTQDGMVRLFYADTTAIVQKAHQIHNTSKTMTAVLGRALTGASLMGTLLKDKGSSVTLQFKGDGPAGTVLCVSDYAGNVRGCAGDPTVELPPNAKGKLDVGGAVGHGTLYVMKDLGMREPYIGTSPIVSGEIAEDITSYFAASEQTPTVCALGVRCNTDHSCRAAGGYLLQLMPGAEDSLIDRLEKSIGALPPISSMILECASNEEAIARILDGFEYDIFDELDIGYKCTCSREKYADALVSLGYDELNEMVTDGKPIETVCRFCRSKYIFTQDELKELLSRCPKK